MVGNKIDLDNRTVPYQLAKDFCETNQVLFREVSAKNDVNISEIFMDIANKVPKVKPERDVTPVKLGGSMNPEPDSGGSCC
jgi:translation elongation factor EF-4